MQSVHHLKLGLVFGRFFGMEVTPSHPYSLKVGSVMRPKGTMKIGQFPDRDKYVKYSITKDKL